MLDIANIPSSQNNVQTFTQAGAWDTWIKPRKARYIQILCIGGGAGGGAGNPGGSGVSAGGGGGSAGYMQAGFQANILPDVLYLYVGRGGNGAVTGTGASGERSFVAVTPDSTVVTGILCASSNAVPTGGGQGVSSGAGGPGGTGATVATIANARLLQLGVFFASAGSNGGTGGLSSGTPALVITDLLSGGAGGGANGTSGAITGGGPFPSTPVLPATTSSPRDGIRGIAIYRPIMAFMGGLGGTRSSGTTTPPGTGGTGAYGCGGGGGGAGNTLYGRGGDGGSGLIMITTYV